MKKLTINRKDCRVYISSFHKEVTGSRIFVTVKLPNKGRIYFFVDYGTFQEQNYIHRNLEPSPCKMKKFLFGVGTHGHQDHIGGWGQAVKEGFKGKFYVTYGTKSIMKPFSKDSYRIVEKDKTLKDRYSDTDLRLAISMTHCVEYRKTFQPHPNIKVTFFENAHMVGAAITLIQISTGTDKDINLLFTGDYKGKDIIIDAPELPQWVNELPVYVISESTYGNTVSHPKKIFTNTIKKAVKESKNILIPTLATRSLLILFIVVQLKKYGIIPENYIIGYDGNLLQEFIRICKEEPVHIKQKVLDFLWYDLDKYAIKLNKQNRKKFLENNSYNKIIIASSGMGSFGPSNWYISEMIDSTENLILFTCYCAEGTFGRKLKDTPKGNYIAVGDTVRLVNADVEFTSEFSSHANAQELQEFLQSLNVNAIFINHGQLEVQYAFKNRLKEAMPSTQIEVLNPDFYYELDCNGHVNIYEQSH